MHGMHGRWFMLRAFIFVAGGMLVYVVASSAGVDGYAGVLVVMGVFVGGFVADHVRYHFVLAKRRRRGEHRTP
jgi:hypothetical protein